MPSGQNWAFGLAPVYQIGGGAPVIKHYPMKQGTTNGTAEAGPIYKGQIVGWNVTIGCVKPLAAVAGTVGDNNIIGVAAEYYANSNVDWVRENGHIALWDGAEHVFRIQCEIAEGATVRSLKTFIHRNFPLTHIDDGNTVSGRSIGEAKGSGGTNTAELLRCIGIDKKIKEGAILPGQDLTAGDTDILVRFNHGYLYTEDATMPAEPPA